MHYSVKKSRRVLGRFRWQSEVRNRKMQPVGMVLVLGFIVFLFIDASGRMPWEALLIGFFLLGLCNMLIRYLRPDLHFDLYRRFWPVRLHPMVQAEGDLLYRQLRQLAFSMGEPRAEQDNSAPGTLAEAGKEQ